MVSVPLYDRRTPEILRLYSFDPTMAGAAAMEKPKWLTLRLMIALSAYAILALIATLVLDGLLRTVMWVFFAGLTVRTLILARQQSEEDED